MPAQPAKAGGRLWRVLPLLLLPTALPACSVLGPITGAVAGAAAGTGSVNPIVGYAVAVGVSAGVDELQKYIGRTRHGAEQDAIVEAVGTMAIGDKRPWKIVHDFPLFDDSQGEVSVTRTIETPLTTCKEVLFTVEKGSGADLRHTPFVTSACRDGAVWKWAAAEPATDRWGYFQHISH